MVNIWHVTVSLAVNEMKLITDGHVAGAVVVSSQGFQRTLTCVNHHIIHSLFRSNTSIESIIEHSYSLALALKPEPIFVTVNCNLMRSRR